MKHLCSHAPKNAFCEICRLANARRRPKRKNKQPSERQSQVFGETVDIDYTGSDDPAFPNALIVRDDATGICAAPSSPTRETD